MQLLLHRQNMSPVRPACKGSDFVQGVVLLLQVEEALRLHTADNISVITICFGDDPPPRRTFGGRPHGMPGRSLSMQGLGTLSTALSSALE